MIGELYRRLIVDTPKTYCEYYELVKQTLKEMTDDFPDQCTDNLWKENPETWKLSFDLENFVDAWMEWAERWLDK